MWGTDWSAAGTVGTGQPVKTLGLGQMGMDEGLWWSFSSEEYSSEEGKREKNSETFTHSSSNAPHLTSSQQHLFVISPAQAPQETNRVQ